MHMHSHLDIQGLALRDYESLYPQRVLAKGKPPSTKEDLSSTQTLFSSTTTKEDATASIKDCERGDGQTRLSPCFAFSELDVTAVGRSSYKHIPITTTTDTFTTDFSSRSHQAYDPPPRQETARSLSATCSHERQTPGYQSRFSLRLQLSFFLSSHNHQRGATAPINDRERGDGQTRLSPCFAFGWGCESCR